MVELVLFLIGLGVAVTVENPLNSLFWLTSFMLTLFDKYPGHFTVLQHCMHGGTRDKKSKFLSYNPRKPDTNILESLGILCDGQHQHDSWNRVGSTANYFFRRPKKPLTLQFCASDLLQFVWTKPSVVALALARACNNNLWWIQVLGRGIICSTKQRQQAETSFSRI